MELLKKGTCKAHTPLHTHLHAHMHAHLHTHWHSLSGTLTSRASHPSSGVCAKACPSVQRTGVIWGLINQRCRHTDSPKE